MLCWPSLTTAFIGTSKALTSFSSEAMLSLSDDWRFLASRTSPVVTSLSIQTVSLPFSGCMASSERTMPPLRRSFSLRDGSCCLLAVARARYAWHSRLTSERHMFRPSFLRVCWICCSVLWFLNRW